MAIEALFPYRLAQNFAYYPHTIQNGRVYHNWHACVVARLYTIHYCRVSIEYALGTIDPVIGVRKDILGTYMG